MKRMKDAQERVLVEVATYTEIDPSALRLGFQQRTIDAAVAFGAIRYLRSTNTYKATPKGIAYLKERGIEICVPSR